MEFSETQADHFHRNGFFLVQTPFAESAMLEIERLFRETEAEWRATDWDSGWNSSACRFFLVGEPAFLLAEQPDVLAVARKLLGTDDIHIGACGFGDASERESVNGRRQVPWHVDGGPDIKQVSIRTALDRHDSSNGPLRVLPGTQDHPRNKIQEDLLQLELATGWHEGDHKALFAKHPNEIELILDPRWTLIWTPSCWHATGEKTAAGPRRTICWNYYPADGRHRDREALRNILDGQWQSWSRERRRLWGLS
ncbi:MAG TPA: hypothetical protein DIU35_01980 [Candidatus Latescibacteria bacterium]|nr:hypothetical protein [Gemmatimonadota bacterium]HCR16225.1 hypothetical protein [Candidatus Latescibacterota bacterium]|tara:strand:+ start:4786 stop:5544 length:759 start_codon:yes stop_codon:yes gene_type:complete